MATTTRAAAERFAAATDALRHGVTPPAGGPFAEELALAARLRGAATAGIPDPAFVSALRAELRGRAGARAGGAGEQRAAGPLRYALMDTPVGRLAVAYREGRVVHCAAVDGSDASIAAFERAAASLLGARPERDPRPPAAVARGVRDHLAGRRRLTAVDLSWLPPFRRRVLEKTAEIPRGEVRPYAWVAREIGAPGAVRAVGTALGHNPIPFIIPCHRVVRADGSLGEYSGGGPAVKERVLTLEGVPLAELRAAARRGERYHGCRTTRIVCYPSCRAARRVRPANVVPFASLAEAAAHGYRPCALCRPA
jgi:methylated-DNA-[protein]-cysteine S-methyltransferase